MKIIKINPFTIYFLLILFITGYIKLGLIIFSIVLFHELGHVLISIIFHYHIIDITIYPFGGITKLEKDVNTPVLKELLIASGGILFQGLLFIIIILMDMDFYTKNLFYKYNLSIMLFNMLPIIPLDGSIILKSVLNRFFSFKISYKIYIIVSIISVFLYGIINYWYSLNNYLIITLFIYKIYESIKNYNFIYNRFLLERYLNNYNYGRISTKCGNLDILMLDTYQYFKEGKNIISEKKKLQEKFNN